MPETIRAITETHEGEGYGCESGFKVITDKQEILLLIDDYQSCCETWGYFLTEQDTEKFIGAELRAVEITDTDRSTKPWDRRSWKMSSETTGTLSGDLRELAKLIRDQTEQDWIGVTESNSVNETLESAQAWRHNCRAYAEGVEQAAGYIEDDGLAEAGRSVIADRLAEQLANGVPPEEIEWPEAWANLAREIKKYGGGSRD